MFGIKPKEEPKVEKIDLNRIRAERQPEPSPAYKTPYSRYGLSAHLPTLQFATRPSLPPADLARRFDPTLADLLTAAAEAGKKARDAAQEWVSNEPGAPGFNTVLEEDRKWAARFLDSGKPIPPCTGPLYTELTEGRHRRYADVWHSQVEWDHAEDRVRAHAASSRTLRSALEKEGADITARMAEQLRRAKAAEDRGYHREALRLMAPYAEVLTLQLWASNPQRGWNSHPGALPQELVVLEHETALAVGENRAEVPDEVLFAERQPRPQLAVGDEPNWGMTPPPGGGVF